jgi:hypothetical protein
MIEIFDNILVIGGKEIILPSSIENVIEFTDVYIVNCGSRADKDYSHINNTFIGICGIEKKDGIIKWEFSTHSYPIHIRKVLYNNEEVLNVRIEDTIYIINVQNGNVILKTPTKG